MAIQPAEYCEYNNIPALEAAVIKYVSRHQNKNGVQDLEKARDLINMIIDMRYGCVGIANRLELIVANVPIMSIKDSQKAHLGQLLLGASAGEKTKNELSVIKYSTFASSLGSGMIRS